MAGRGSRLKGAKSTRKLIRNIPEASRLEMAHVLEDAGPKIARSMQGRVSKRTGALRRGIKWKVLRKSLKLQVGLLGTKRGRAKLFYGWILNFGRKGQTVRVKRRTPSGAVTSYMMKVRGFAGQHFVTGQMPDLRRELQRRLRGVWDRILRRASAGVGNE